MSILTYTFAFGNVEQPDSARDIATTIDLITTGAHVVCLNEAAEATTHAEIRKLDSDTWHWFIPTRVGPNENPIIWRHDLFEKLEDFQGVPYIGGRGDGPNRGPAIVVLRHRSTGVVTIVVNLHHVAKAYTSNRGRQSIWKATNDFTVAQANRLAALYPGAGVVYVGDWNRSGKYVVGLTDEKWVRTPATYGRQTYDQIRVNGYVAIQSITKIKTRSDHYGLRFKVSQALLSTGAPASPRPPVVVPAPSPLELSKTAVVKARKELLAGFADLLSGILLLQKAQKGRPVVRAVAATLRTARLTMVAAYGRLPKS